MKALCLWQPHASFVAANLKTIETRNRLTHVRGDVAICSARKAFPFLSADVVALWKEKLGSDPLPAGYILAVVEIYDCLRVNEMWSLESPISRTERMLGD